MAYERRLGCAQQPGYVAPFDSRQNPLLATATRLKLSPNIGIHFYSRRNQSRPRQDRRVLPMRMDLHPQRPGLAAEPSDIAFGNQPGGTSSACGCDPWWRRHSSSYPPTHQLAAHLDPPYLIR